jgi:hypothetical protein
MRGTVRGLCAWRRFKNVSNLKTTQGVRSTLSSSREKRPESAGLGPIFPIISGQMALINRVAQKLAHLSSSRFVFQVLTIPCHNLIQRDIFRLAQF